MTDDQRVKIRRTLRVKGHVLRGNNTALACTLVDISETGARLLTKEGNELPDEFTVAFTPNGTPRRKCRVVWRSDEEVGVAFEITKPGRERQPWASREEVLNAFGLQS